MVDDLFKGAREHGAVPLDRSGKGPVDSRKPPVWTFPHHFSSFNGAFTFGRMCWLMDIVAVLHVPGLLWWRLQARHSSWGVSIRCWREASLQQPTRRESELVWVFAQTFSPPQKLHQTASGAHWCASFRMSQYFLRWVLFQEDLHLSVFVCVRSTWCWSYGRRVSVWTMGNLGTITILAMRASLKQSGEGEFTLGGSFINGAYGRNLRTATSMQGSAVINLDASVRAAQISGQLWHRLPRLESVRQNLKKKIEKYWWNKPQTGQ